MDARTVERTARVYMDDAQPRCEPSRHCTLRNHCARYVAALPDQGAAMADFSLEPLFNAVACRHYVSAASCTRHTPHTGQERRRHPHWDGQDV